uniref:Glutamic acid-rich protein-like n=1 Tax=Tanacetum cinerariifolium TaxID=118510 RepID=A0A699IUI8_TANCI|nr:glutamic acid-rich protein-like [Tanacetum cinerariifolium]
MGYEKPSTKLTFYKAFFSSQWKFLIHTLLQSLSAKRTSWNEFSTAMAYAVICLSKGQKFNFSKYIFVSLVRNVDSSSKFYIYPRFIQLIIQNQVSDLSTHTTRTMLQRMLLMLLFHHHHLITFHLLLKNNLHLLNNHKVYLKLHQKDVFNQGRMIDDLDKDEGIELAKIYHLDLDHPSKVLSMQKDDSKVQEVVEVVTIAKLITDVVTAASQDSTASATISAAKPSIYAAAPTVVAAYTRRRK